jgi:hypothetical protein
MVLGDEPLESFRFRIIGTDVLVPPALQRPAKEVFASYFSISVQLRESIACFPSLYHSTHGFSGGGHAQCPATRISVLPQGSA